MRNISKEMSQISEERIVSKMKCKFLILFVVAAMAALLSPPSASALSILGTELASFAVLGASTVTNVPTSTIVGNVGVWSSGGANAITGFGNTAQVTGGTLQAGTDLAKSAQGQLTTARTSLGLLGPGLTITEGNLDAWQTSHEGHIIPGVYTVPEATTNLVGTLTLDGLGNANARWVFLMPSSLITSSNSAVNVIKTGAGAGVFWNVGSSATLNAGTSFEGNILALTSVWLKTGATIGCGRALASTGEVTMDTNAISIGCLDTGEGSNGLSGGTVPTPIPSAAWLLGSGLLGLIGLQRRRARKA